MAENIVDIVHRLSFDVEDAELVAASKEVSGTLAKLAALTNQLSAYEAKIKSTSRLEISERKAIQQQIDKTRQAIGLQTQALEMQVLSNKKLQTEIAKEVGLIGQLQKQMDILKQKRDISTDTTKIKQYNRELAQTQAQMSALTSPGGRGVLSGLSGSILQGVGIGTGIGLVTQGIGALKSFIDESSELAGQLEGVQRAFDRLNQPGLLGNLREATKGTVSDLELMKNAVQFSNFGLPVEKFATALQFARIRAKETGQDVNYLVQSITTGIGRQSPLILDNLGINAKRVADEFKRTGNFAEAAFKIIQEESAKAGADLETFAEKQARLNAQIANAQAGFGKVFNELKGFLFELGKDFTVDFGNAQSNADKYIQTQREIREATAETTQVNANANALFLQNFERFVKEYANADLTGRAAIKQQQKDLYSTLATEAQKYYGDDLKNYNFYLQGLQQASTKAQQQFKAQGINLQTLSVSSIRGQSLEELKAIQDQIENARTSLTSGDSSLIQKYDQLNTAIQKEIDIIGGGKYKKDQTEAIRLAKERAEALQKLRDAMRDVLLELRKLPEGLPDSGLFRTITPRQEELLSPKNQDQLRKSGIFEGEVQSTFLTPGQAARLEVDKEIRDKKKKEDKKAEDDLKETIEKQVGFYSEAATTIIGTFQAIYDARLQFLDAEIQISSARITAATALAERGNTEILNQEIENLNTLQAEREKIAQRQLVVNAALRASEAALVVVQALQTVTSAGTKGDPYTIPLRIAAAVAALAAGFGAVYGLVSAGQGFAEGGYTGDGGKYEPKGVVHGGEFVMTKEKTAQYRPLLEMLHTGKVKDIPYIGGGYATKSENKALEKKMDTLIESVNNIHFSARNTMDGNGVTQVIQTTLKRSQNKFK